MKRGMNCFYNRAILPFSHTILLRSVWCCSLFNSSFYAIILEFIRFILGPIISPQHLDFLLELVFDQGFEVSEPGEHFILPIQELDQSLARIIICKDEIIEVASQRVYRHHNRYVRVDQLQYICELAIT